MLLRWNRKESILYIAGLEDAEYVATSTVRNELNGRRRLHDPKEVVRAVVNGQYGPAYMPRPFPTGIWHITGIEIIHDESSEYWPLKIKTDAQQEVETWALDDAGGYAHPTGETVTDGGYWLHWTPSKTTLGCLRIGTDNAEQVRELAGFISAALDRREVVVLEVL